MLQIGNKMSDEAKKNERMQETIFKKMQKIKSAIS